MYAINTQFGKFQIDCILLGFFLKRPRKKRNLVKEGPRRSLSFTNSVNDFVEHVNNNQGPRKWSPLLTGRRYKKIIFIWYYPPNKQQIVDHWETNESKSTGPVFLLHKRWPVHATHHSWRVRVGKCVIDCWRGGESQVKENNGGGEYQLNFASIQEKIHDQSSWKWLIEKWLIEKWCLQYYWRSARAAVNACMRVAAGEK